MEYLKFTPELAHDWKNALSTSEPYVFKRVLDSMNRSQLESKLWIIQELIKLEIEPKRVAILAGWYSQYIIPLLIEHGVEFIYNFEIDRDAKDISYKFNKRYKDQEKYECHITDIMFKEIWRKEENYGAFDVLINTSCEHMFPMRRFRELNKNLSGNPIYVLQSTNEDKYEDHINCVSGPEELAEQAELINVVYSGTKVLDNGMKRFMVIGK
jgi:hypothetical protein|tara:strand:- start:351 stop:986 length:636 start_codon:yes stop_codon:yes gene_type:complete